MWHVNYKTKNVNDFLTEKLTVMERSCQRDDQHSKRENLEIVAIPSSINNCNLENAVCSITSEVDVDKTGNTMEKFHRVSSKGDILVKFSSRKTLKQVLKVTRNQKNIYLEEVKLNGVFNVKLFTNQTFVNIKKFYDQRVESFIEWRIYLPTIFLTETQK